MIGNDLVDLHQAAIDSNWKRPGYLNKIFTLEEQELILTAHHQDQMVWLLWSMKEAAYKIHSRKNGIRNFAPTSLSCSHIQLDQANSKGQVVVGNQFFYTSSVILDSYIHTIATEKENSFSTIKTAIYQFPDNQFDYSATNPSCVSHHGQYLALIFEESQNSTH